jgi:predicted dehydrogenase
MQDWIVDPEFPLVWRLQRSAAGSGALGDIGAHIVDMAQYLTGDVLTGVSALTETFIRERPLPAKIEGSAASSGLAASGSTEKGTVDVDDAALFLGRFAEGAVASFEATRFATGRKNALRIELNGSRGSLAFDQERMNELEFYDGTEDPDTAGFRRILVTEPTHPYVGAWWPPGHLLGYEHAFTHQVVDLVRDIGEGRDPAPSFADGLRVQLVLDAVEKSASSGSWQKVAEE